MPRTRQHSRRARAFLSSALIAFLFGQLFTATAAAAQGRAGRRGAAPARSGDARVGPAARRDPQVAAMLREIDAARIEANIRKLVSFGTRNTLSRQDDPA